MKKESIATGATIEEAKKLACLELGVSEQEAEFEIINVPQKKKLGLFGGSDAKVRAFIVVEEPKDTSCCEKNDIIEDKKVVETDVIDCEKDNSANSTMSFNCAEQKAYDYVKSIITSMGIAELTINSSKIEKGISFNIECKNAGLVVGRKGETLDAIQYLASLAANNNSDTYERITLNVGNYREQREQTLNSLAIKMGKKAKATKRKVFLEPMNPYERRIVHTALQELDGVTSWSENEGMRRHIVIAPSFMKPSANGNNYNRKNTASHKNNAHKSTSHNKRVDNTSATYSKLTNGTKKTTSLIDEPFPDFVIKDEAPVSPLYGKINKNKD